MKSERIFLVTCTLAFHSTFSVVADDIKHAAIKAEKIVKDISADAEVTKIETSKMQLLSE